MLVANNFISVRRDLKIQSFFCMTSLTWNQEKNITLCVMRHTVFLTVFFLTFTLFLIKLLMPLMVKGHQIIVERLGAEWPGNLVPKTFVISAQRARCLLLFFLLNFHCKKSLMNVIASHFSWDIASRIITMMLPWRSWKTSSLAFGLWVRKIHHHFNSSQKAFNVFRFI